jgi:MFS family permease
VILGFQSLLSVRLVWSNTAFQDEALYLWAGHVEWSHWLYGAPVPELASYFSGAPVIYPVLGAVADTYGGLATARLLSLCFMLGSTWLLYLITRRLFGSKSALFSAAMFAGLAASQFLGAFATYDAMAVALLAGATWLGIRAADSRRRRRRLALLILAGAALALADMTKYAATLFDPVVIAAAATFAWRQRGYTDGLGSAFVLLLTPAVLLGAALAAGGRPYWLGLTSTTLNRSSGVVPAPGIVYISLLWVGSIALLAVIGAAVVFAKDGHRSMRWLACVLAGAVFLAPAEQARIHTVTSLFKHVGFGAWFGCIVAGFALTSFISAVPPVKVAGAVRAAIAAAVVSAVIGIAFSTGHFTAWPNSAAFIAKLTPVAAAQSGPILEDNKIPQYYVPDLRWRTAISTPTFYYLNPVTGNGETGLAAYADAVKHKYFSIIVLGFTNTIPVDDSIERDIAAAGTYRLTAVVAYVADGTRGAYKIWVRAPRPARRQARAGRGKVR